MKKLFFSTLLVCMGLCSCTVSHIDSSVLTKNYEHKIHNTTPFGKIFKFDKKKLDTYENVKVFLDGNDIKSNYEVVGYGAYTPVVIPILRPERPRLEKYLLWKAARRARKVGANGVIIDNKNDFTIINLK